VEEEGGGGCRMSRDGVERQALAVRLGYGAWGLLTIRG